VAQLAQPSIILQPNRKFERDPNASHPGPSTLALNVHFERQVWRNAADRCQPRLCENTFNLAQCLL
jgi:hypothetical protein